MNLTLDRTARRVVGALIEKEMTTPGHYPLTVNALVSACNQKSNRDPVMNLREFEVEGVLRSLFVAEWVTNVKEAGARTVKWKHRARERLTDDPAELAILCELMLRGPQAVGELRAHANRMHPLADAQATEAILARLAERGLVRRLPRRPGERAPRWDHTLHEDGEEPDERHEESAGPPHARGADGVAAAPELTQNEILRRLEALEARVDELTRRLQESDDGTNGPS